VAAGLRAVALFPRIRPDLKDPRGSAALDKDGLYARALRAIKDKHPDLCLISDVAMDPYSSDGHDGLVREGKVVNDPTLDILAAMSVLQAEAGADFVAASDMMDGRIRAIRRALDHANLTDTGIISYAAKYASAYYGPFRDALASAPKSGDKKTYQMDPANAREALREVSLDIQEGADVILIKPALAYLDIVAQVRTRCWLPIAAYNVSGEYAMVKAASANGWLDEKRIVLETLTAMARAGADMIFTYHALDAARWINQGES
jgi:porphobilinogen synthase